MLKTIKTDGRLYEIGKTYDVHATVAGGWVAMGICEFDKMIDVPPETKRIVPPIPKRKRWGASAPETK
jgi:hypothetical protein